MGPLAVPRHLLRRGRDAPSARPWRPSFGGIERASSPWIRRYSSGAARATVSSFLNRPFLVRLAEPTSTLLGSSEPSGSSADPHLGMQHPVGRIAPAHRYVLTRQERQRCLLVFFGPPIETCSEVSDQQPNRTVTCPLMEPAQAERRPVTPCPPAARPENAASGNRRSHPPRYALLTQTQPQFAQECMTCVSAVHLVQPRRGRTVVTVCGRSA